jgi:hypothetical protein
MQGKLAKYFFPGLLIAFLFPLLLCSASCPRENTHCTHRQEARWASELVWSQRLEEKSFASTGERTSVVQSVLRHCTDLVIKRKEHLYNFNIDRFNLFYNIIMTLLQL